MIIDIAAAVFVTIGAGFMFIASVGVIRFPDLYSRMSAVSKAATLGLSSLAVAVVLNQGNDPYVILRALAVIAFTALTTPISAHLLARSAYVQQVPLWEGTIRDELRGRYESERVRPPGSKDVDGNGR